jgi:hypothetical protein
MAKNAHKTAAPAPAIQEEAILVLAEQQTSEAIVESAVALLQADGDENTAETVVRARSVVPKAYKATYAVRALARGDNSKAAKRANGDWLARELQAECVQDGKTFDLQRFLAICDANGVDALARWPNRNAGWEGRLRMSGAIVLRGIVGKTGVLRTPDGETDVRSLASEGDEVAAAFVAKHANG